MLSTVVRRREGIEGERSDEEEEERERERETERERKKERERSSQSPYLVCVCVQTRHHARLARRAKENKCSCNEGMNERD